MAVTVKVRAALSYCQLLNLSVDKHILQECRGDWLLLHSVLKL